MTQNLSLYVSFDYSEPNLTISCSTTLTTDQLNTLNTLITNYTDPSVFISFDHATVDNTLSDFSNSLTPLMVKSSIFTSTNTSNQSIPVDSIKCLLEIKTDALSNISGTSGSITLEIYDFTRKVDIVSQTLDISDVISSWKTNGPTANIPDPDFKTIQISDLRNQTTNYDCIWNYNLSVSDINISARIHSLQQIYYSYT
jgi:hypothetical protein